VLNNCFSLPFWERVKYLLVKSIPTIIIGKVKHNLIHAYWGWGTNNFGDLLTPMLLKYYGLSPVHAYERKARYVGVGTLLGHITTSYKGVIMGSGLNDPITKLFPHAQIIGLRGKLSQQMLQLESQPIVLGDPGLLASRIFPERQAKKWVLGIVPHLSEKNHPIVKKWERQFKDKNVKFINVIQSPEKAIKEIDQCSHIFSSSLHGLVIADSLEIPNCRFIIEGAHVYKYNDFRFDDYYSALNVEGTKIKVNGEETLEQIMSSMRDDFSMLEPMKDNLDMMFKKFVKEYKIA